MALNEQMKEAIQADIADESSKKERIDEQMGALKTVGKTAVENIPGVGEAILAKDIAGDVSEGNYASAALGTAALGVGFLPAGDILNKPIKAAAKKLRKQDVADAEELLGNADKLEQWRKSNKLPESQRQKNIPEAEQAAEDLFQNKIKSKEARQKIKEVFPEPKLYMAETMPEMPTVTDVVGAMGKKSEKGILGVKGFDLEPGQRVGARLDIPAYNEYDKWVVSIHDGKTRNGSVVGYGQAIRLKNIEFGSDPKVALDIAKGKRVAKSTGEEKPMGKATIARVFGDYVPEDPYELHQFAKKVLANKDSGWTQVGMNPYRGSYFYDKATGTPVTRADEVIQVGPLVLAKNVTKPKMSELKEMFKPAARTAEGKLRVFNEGGAVMDKQMDMFDDGGLMQEGGTVDPESGNEVPVGSTQEEVRDDIPAQLSEGEFVFPADVVRYIGLENLMRMRQEAKMGLAQMEAMGQMGNSEEATMPDDLPFDMYDLEVEDDGVQEFAQGGVVKAQAGTFVQPQGFTGIGGYQASQFGTYQPQYTPYTPPATPSGQALSQQYTPATQQFTPTTAQQAPTFTGFTGIAAPSPGGYDEMKTYVDDAGMEMQIPFKDGSPIYPIPEGYKLKTEEVQTATTTTTTGAGTPTARPDSDDDPSDEPQYSTSDTTGIGYDRSKIKNEALLDVLGKSAAAQAKDLAGVAGVATGSPVGMIAQVGKGIAREKGLMSGKTAHAGAVLGGVIDQFRDPTGAVNYVTGRKSGSYSITTALHELSNTQQQMLADTFYSVNQKMNSIYTKQEVGKDGKTTTVTKSSAEIKQSLVDTVKELGLDKTVFTDKTGKTMTDEALSKLRQETLEREISKAYAKQVGEERRTAAEQLASQYGINAAGKSIEEINAEVNKARADAEASARREREYLSRVGGYSDDDGGMGGFTVSDGRGGTYTTDSSGTSGAFTGGPTGMEDEYDFNKGGLAKQMKQSGLASKK